MGERGRGGEEREDEKKSNGKTYNSRIKTILWSGVVVATVASYKHPHTHRGTVHTDAVTNAHSHLIPASIRLLLWLIIACPHPSGR